MLGKTHLAVGMGAALAMTQPTTLGGCFAALIGGTVGGILPDVDAIRTDRKKGATESQGAACMLTMVLLVLDSVLSTGLWAGIAARDRDTLTAGGVLFIALWFFSFWSAHRSFTHSLAGVCLFTVAVQLLCPDIAGAFLVGYVSHLVLDLLNKRPLKLFYPLDDGVCLGLFYANRTANSLCLYAGCALTVFFLVRLGLQNL